MEPQPPITTTPVPAPPVAPQKPKNNSFLIVLLSVSLLLATSLAGFFALQTQKLAKQLAQIQTSVSLSPSPTEAPTAESTPTPDPTANWKMYTNTKYKFELKYPTNLPSFKTKIIGTSDKPFYVIRESFSSENFGTDYGIEIDIWDNPSKSTLKAWLESMKNAQALALPTENFNLTPNYAINGKEALRFWLDPVSKGQEPGKCVQSCPINNVYVALNDKVYRILFGFSREVNDEDLLILNQILSTFQFSN